MKFKSKLTASLVALGVLASSSFLTDVSAAETTSTYYDRFGDSVVETTTYDSSGNPISVSVEKWKVTAKAPYWSAKSDISRSYEFPNVTVTLNGTGTSGSYTSKSKSKYYSIDKIGVSTTLTSGGTVMATKSKTNEDSGYAAATARKSNVLLPPGKYKDTSSHTFEHAGYNSWYPNTEATDKWS
ncbi:hypothetical protein [Rummeliibacillus sp. SL167]|uniref:hypothetical protein n=1 Tax=Rummeliibacillus sp. SL167 TaxID=2579792 RepID=UPI0011B427BA|nr:hypothetical protein [Rummeliibacillus sp. SL167]